MEHVESKGVLVASTAEIRAIDRIAESRDYNRRLHPAALLLLDPEGRHIVTPWMVHEHAQGKPVAPHLRCRALIKLVGTSTAHMALIDIPMELVPETFPDPKMEVPDTEDVSIVVGGEGDAEPAAGLVLDKANEKIVGVLPGTYAATLGLEELSKLTGLPVDWDRVRERERRVGEAE